MWDMHDTTLQNLNSLTISVKKKKLLKQLLEHLECLFVGRTEMRSEAPKESLKSCHLPHMPEARACTMSVCHFCGLCFDK